MKHTSNDSLSARLKELPGGSYLNIRSVPPFAVGATLAVLWTWLMSGLPAKWLMALAAALLYFSYRTYLVYVGRIEDGQRHAREMADLHLATIEALALAIDAKDRTSHSHLRRVQLYATSVARVMGMSENDVEGVKTAVPTGGTSLLNLATAAAELSPAPDNIYLVTDGLPTLGKAAGHGTTIIEGSGMDIDASWLSDFASCATWCVEATVSSVAR